MLSAGSFYEHIKNVESGNYMQAPFENGSVGTPRGVPRAGRKNQLQKVWGFNMM